MILSIYWKKINKFSSYEIQYKYGLRTVGRVLLQAARETGRTHVVKVTGLL